MEMTQNDYLQSMDNRLSKVEDNTTMLIQKVAALNTWMRIIGGILAMIATANGINIGISNLAP